MGAELFAEEGVLKGIVLVLEGNDEWVVGRDPDLSSIILEDPKVSRKHLRVKKSEEGFLIENLSDTNPVEVNDLPILKPYFLQEGDRLKIGSTYFRFYHEGHPEAPQERLEDIVRETIYRPEEEGVPSPAGTKIDLSLPSRFILKVIAGPNTGAEFSLEEGKEYLIGTDTLACDIVFYDLSVSKEHARLEVTKEGRISIEDLASRNGVVIDRKRIGVRTSVPPNTVVALGTSAFFIVDREAPLETITPPLPPLPSIEEKEEFIEEEIPSLKEEKREMALAKKIPLPPAAALLIAIISSLAVLMAIGLISLFKTKEVVVAPINYLQEIQSAVRNFSGVKFTYNPTTRQLFLVGHVATGVEKSELLYNLRGLPFLSSVEDNVVIDESVWQEMNILLSKQPGWKGVTMHSPAPGEFVLTGYLRTTEEFTALIDYMNYHFAYLGNLQYLVVVEEMVLDQVHALLVQDGFEDVTPTFANGILILSGYISAKSTDQFTQLLTHISDVQGVREVRNYVVGISPEQAVVDLNERLPGQFEITGFSKHCGVNINVVINGRIYSRGEIIEGGFMITSIQPRVIFLEREGLKYKIEYSK